MTVLGIDLESRSAVDLRRAGVHRYAADPTTDLWCACYAFDDEPVETWVPGEPCPDRVRRHVLDGEPLFAFNAGFERVMWQSILGPRYGWPVPKLEQWEDTAAWGAAMGLPRGLGDAARAMGLPQEKDDEGHRLMLRMSKPRKARKAETAEGLLWWDDADRVERLLAYCRQDVEAERALRKALFPLQEQERETWLFDQRMNDRGVRIDLELVHSLHKLGAWAAERLDAEMAEATGGWVTACTQVNRLTEWLRDVQGVPATSLAKAALEEMLLSDLPPDARRAVEIRQLAAKTSTKKLDAVLACVDDGRARGQHLYYGASTGRWCLPAYSPVTVRRGDEVIDVPIVEVTTADLVWDGDAWVGHEGVVFSGHKPVMSYGGVVATPEHRVYVSPELAVPLADAAKHGRSLWRGASPVRDLPSNVAVGEVLHRTHANGALQAVECARKACDGHVTQAPAAGFNPEAHGGGLFAGGVGRRLWQAECADIGARMDREAAPGAEPFPGRGGRRGGGLDHLLGRDARGPRGEKGLPGPLSDGVSKETRNPPRLDRRDGGEGAALAGAEPPRSVSGDHARAENVRQSARCHASRPPVREGRKALDSVEEGPRGPAVVQDTEIDARPMGRTRPEREDYEYLGERKEEVGASRGPGRTSGAASRSAEEHRPLRRSEGAPSRGHPAILGGETRREATYDIINAGPRNRFRAWGTIVSNSGRLIQVQNMPRGTGTVTDPDAAAADFMDGRPELIQFLYGAPMNAISDMLRACFVASPGCRLLVADFSAIEGRVTAWLAGEEHEVQAYRDADRGIGSEIYKIAAGGIFNVAPAEVTKAQRQVGKVACIAEGQPVLTLSGLKPIQEVLPTDEIWDGEAWVGHEGVVFQGVRDVWEYDGLVATEDHIVFTEDGRTLPFGACARQQIRLAQTGLGREAVRLGDGHRPGDHLEGQGGQELARHRGQARVYDIVNAGPRHRFTVSGRLVHNCLALGFQGGVMAFNSMAAIYRVNMADAYEPLLASTDTKTWERAEKRYAECLERQDTGTDVMTREAWIASEVTKVLWRAKHPATQALWRGLEEAAFDAVLHPGTTFSFRGIDYVVGRGFLWCKLPSGRVLAYGGPKISERETPWGERKSVVTVLGVDSVTRRWSRYALYGGLATENCLAGDTEVLTDAGWRRLDMVRRDHRVWDGAEWVRHDGLLRQGHQETIDFGGVRMTPDHKVWTAAGWRRAEETSYEEAASQGTEPDRPSVRPTDGDGLRRVERGEVAVASALRLRDGEDLGRRRAAKGQHAKLRLPAGGTTPRPGHDARNVGAPGLCSVAQHDRPLHPADAPGVAQLRGPRYRRLRTVARLLRRILAGHGADLRSRADDRAPRQLEGLRAGQLRVGNAPAPVSEQEGQPHDRHARGTDASLRGFGTIGHRQDDASLSVEARLAGGADVRRPRQHEPVFDLLNAGPRHRFTVRGADDRPFIVSNCVQAIARDLIRDGMLAAEAAGYPIVLTVHDEAVADVPNGFGSLAEFERLLCSKGPWADGLPVVAEGYEAQRYRK